MNNLQKYIKDQNKEHGRSFNYLHEKVFNFMSRQTFHMMKKTGDITRMPIWRGLKLSEITGMSIEQMIAEITPNEPCGGGE